jgi:A/G-specific adenine glycosylase
MDIVFFRQTLQLWHRQHPRPLPWKQTCDPYPIWLSEIILQQTRVEQGRPYYERFLAAYPTIQHLAAAPDSAVFKLWEGLGYYSRCRNLLATARQVVELHNGIFPNTWKEIRALPGVGDYTAAAIASFAFNLPHAVVDGNVYRVLSRWSGNTTPIDSTAGKKWFAETAQHLLNLQDPAGHNQAIMDFGATWCTPRQPQCRSCPMVSQCVAFNTGQVEQLPVKEKKMVKKERYFLFIVAVTSEETTWLQRRIEKDIWQDLYTFPSIELPHLVQDGNEVLKIMQQAGWPMPSSPIQISNPYQQTLTHREVKAIFATFNADPICSSFLNSLPEIALVSTNHGLNTHPLPRLIVQYWSDLANPQLELFS